MHLFLDHGILSVNDITGHTGISHGCAVGIIQRLLQEGKIIRTEDQPSSGGRKSKRYMLNADYMQFGLLALECGEQNYRIRASVYDLRGGHRYDRTHRSSEGSWTFVRRVIRAMLSASSETGFLVLSIPGVCRDGFIDVCDFEGLSGMNLNNRIEKEFHIPCMMENDINSAVIGLIHHHPEYQSAALLYQPSSHYVGCGLMVNRTLYKGHTSFAGELRYLPCYTHEEQDRMLKEDPQKLLLLQAETITAVMNPELIGYCSDADDVTLSFEHSAIPENHRPMLVKITNLNEQIDAGLYRIGMKYIRSIV